MESEAKEQVGVWNNQAHQWSRIGSPLRPCSDDSLVLDGEVQRWNALHGPPRALQLGVTPEIRYLNWPEGSQLLAADHCQNMIEKVWPGFPTAGQGALLADWRNLPLPDASFDLVLSDGWPGVLRFPDMYAPVVREAFRLLAPGGRFVFRAFIRPESREEPAAVFADALEGKITSFHAFKLRLLMALQPSTEEGVITGDVLRYWECNGLGVTALAEKAGWSEAQIRTMDAYRDQKTLYSFPTLDELLAVISGSRFAVVDQKWPSYELGARCPTLILEKPAAGYRCRSGALITHGQLSPLEAVPFHSAGPLRRWLMADSSLHPDVHHFIAVHHFDEVTPLSRDYCQPHVHTFDEINVFHSTSHLRVKVTLNDEVVWIEAPATLFIPAGVSHSANVHAGSGFLLVILMEGSYRAQVASEDDQHK